MLLKQPAAGGESRRRDSILLTMKFLRNCPSKQKRSAGTPCGKEESVASDILCFIYFFADKTLRNKYMPSSSPPAMRTIFLWTPGSYGIKQMQGKL